MTTRLGARPVALVVALALLGMGLAGCAKGQGSTASFCTTVKTLPNRDVLLGRLDPLNRAEMSTYGAQAVKEMAKLERDAPREIKPDVAQVADVTEQVSDLVKKYGSDQTELQYRLYDLARHRIGSASSLVKVTGFIRDKCHVDVTPTRRRTYTDSGSGYLSGPDSAAATHS